jgi:hypothetical protein
MTSGRFQVRRLDELELYDGATKVGELTKGQGNFTVKDLKAGYHAFLRAW